MAFSTHHWRGCRLDDDALERARAELSAPTSELARRQAFLELLRSGQTVAVGIALDHYHYADSLTRFGSESAFSVHAAEVLDRSRDVLRDPPSPAQLSAVTGEGANHASAMTAMMNLAEPEDSELIAGALAQTVNPHVRRAAVMAADAAVRKSAVPSQELVDVLASVIFDAGIPARERAQCLRAFAYAESPEAVAVVVAAAQQDDLDVQVEAAYVLACQDVTAYRDLLERLSDSWPKDAPYPANEVRDFLSGENEE